MDAFAALSFVPVMQFAFLAGIQTIVGIQFVGNLFIAFTNE